jgi:hypothetical protein
MIFSILKANRYFFILLLFFPFIAVAQKSIQGTVISETTGLPIEGASVYFNNTSIGTSANAAGKFSLTVPDMTNAELIISGVGFQLMVFKPGEAGLQNKNLLFKLLPKEQSLKEVLILTDPVRKRYLAIFEREFLGITEEASRSAIKNKKDIYFTSGDTKNSIKAYSDTPLVIINKMLGYKISFDLGEFFYDQQNGRTFYYGYTRFEEMGDKKSWVKNRKHCYYGSTVHFYRSLITNDLKKQGYQIYVIKPVHFTNDGNNKEVNAKPSEKEEMAMAVSVTAAQIITADSSDSNNYNVTVPGKLMVQYERDPSSKEYLRKNTFIQGNLPTGFRSYVTVKAPFISINNAGIINNPMDVEYSGYWIYEKAANMLPFNYTPN